MRRQRALSKQTCATVQRIRLSVNRSEGLTVDLVLNTVEHIMMPAACRARFLRPSVLPSSLRTHHRDLPRDIAFFPKENCRSMWDTVTIRLATNVVLHSSLGGLRKWLPDVVHRLGFAGAFDGRRLISQMAEAFSKTLLYPITSGTIVATLEEFIGYLAPKSNFAASTGTRLDEHMKDCLRKDLGTTETSDLRRSRHRFLIFCSVAQATRSQALAMSMVGFLQGHLDDVVYREQPGLLREWYMGLSALEGLIFKRVLEQLLGCFSGAVSGSYNTRRQFAYDDPRAEFMMKRQPYPLFGHQRRRASLTLESPARYRRRHHPFQVAYPWVQPNDHFVDTGELKHQQGEINMKLDHINRRLNRWFN